jgi:hypothetical protein
MKKVIILILIFTILANCEISSRKVEAQESLTLNHENTNNFYKLRHNYSYHEEFRDEMKYGIWSLNNDDGYVTSQTGYTIAVVNLTKEALEVELLKLQITELANKKVK